MRWNIAISAIVACTAGGASAQVMIDEFADIHAGSPTDHSILISWTAENTFEGGSFQSYELRLLPLSQITNPSDPESAANSYWNEQWDAEGILVPGLPDPPGDAGTPESVTALGLEPDTTYYFRLKAIYTLFPQGIDTAHFKYGIVSETTTQDLAAPDQVIGLQSTGETASSIRLAWTSPHEDEGDPASGPPVRYELFYAPASQLPLITAATIGSAEMVTVTSVNLPGETETFELGGLAPEVSYALAVRAVDDHDQAGPLSSTLSAKTGAPAVSGEKKSLFACAASAPSGVLLLLLLLPAAAILRR